MIATSAAARLLARRTFPTATVRFSSVSLEAYEDYGKNVFTGTVANEYLEKHGASGAILKNPAWVKTHSDVVAKAVFDWYVCSSNGFIDQVGTFNTMQDPSNIQLDFLHAGAVLILCNVLSTEYPEKHDFLLDQIFLKN